MAARPTADQLRLCAAAFLRSVVAGMTGILLALYLHSIGWEIRRIGLLVSAGLAGMAVATLATSLLAHRFGCRRTLLALGALCTGGALALAVAPARDFLFVAAFLGMINGLGRDRGPAYALEQALLPETTTPERRTLVLAWYSLALDVALALGSLLAGLPVLLRGRLAIEPEVSYRGAWLLCAALLFVSMALYARLSPHLEASAAAGNAGRAAQITPESRRRVFGLAALTGMDSLGGGFLSSALVSYWFFERFGAGEEWLGVIFFGARVLNAGSHLVAAWLARRIGLVNTMVFTHIPSSLFLIAVPFAPSLGWAVALFLAREGLVEMDVPTRQSYILAVVRPEERAFASGITTLTRNVAYAVAPGIAGVLMRTLSAASPLFVGGGIKIVYDILLYISFRRIRPPEER
jgi:MFS family permease